MPVQLLRGGESDLLLRCTALGMAARGGVELVEFGGVGHAPALVDPAQIAAVCAWLGR
jgi:pimeloyl-ACP methyl ester carboxylesterase